LATVLNDRQILNMQKLVANVPGGDYVIAYAARSGAGSRPKDETAPDFVKKMVDGARGPGRASI